MQTYGIMFNLKLRHSSIQVVDLLGECRVNAARSDCDRREVKYKDITADPATL